MNESSPSRQELDDNAGAVQAHLGHNFNRMRVYPAETLAKSRTRTRPSNADPSGLAFPFEVQTVPRDAGTQSPDAGTPKPDAGTPKPPPDNCSVASGPSYSPTGNIPAIDYGMVKAFNFKMAATFDTDTAKSIRPSCCSVRQFIKWDKVAHKANGGPPHKGFPSSAKADTWIEDRDLNNKWRYGYRAGPFSNLSDDCFDRYSTGGTRDDANGDDLLWRR